MKYSFSDWNCKTGNIPVLWKKSDYEDQVWVPNHSKRGYTTPKENYDIYKDRLGMHILSVEKADEGTFLPSSMKKVFDYVVDFFKLDKAVYSFMKYPVGNILPWHHDTYPVYCKNNQVSNIESIVRIVVFLHDSEPGQQLWIGDKICTGVAGSWFSWMGSKEHMAANLSKKPRYVLQITGVNAE